MAEQPKLIGYANRAFATALQLRGVPAGAKLLPCPKPLACGCRPPDSIGGTCHTCSGAVVRPGRSVGLELVVICFPCLNVALDDAKNLTGAPQ